MRVALGTVVTPRMFSNDPSLRESLIIIWILGGWQRRGLPIWESYNTLRLLKTGGLQSKPFFWMHLCYCLKVEEQLDKEPCMLLFAINCSVEGKLPNYNQN